MLPKSRIDTTDGRAAELPLLEVEQLAVDIPTASGELRAVRGVSFALDKGENLGIVGESGCGKSLTALAIMNLLPKTARRSARRLVFSGIDLKGLRDRQMADIRGNRIAMIFQDPMTSLNPAYTIGNQLMEAILRHRKITKSKARQQAVALLEKTGITGAASRLGQYPHQLSGGLRQRVMIAMALICEPELLIADEPTTALDVTIQAQILNQLARLQHEFHMAMILITHDLGVVARIVDRLIVMYAGKIVETGSTQEIFENPLHPYTQGLLTCIPVPGKTKRGEHLGTIPGIVPTLIGKIAGCGYFNRCPLAQTKCAVKNPDFKIIAPGRGYCCRLESDHLKNKALEVEK
jgi:peptide/nickel transport system ATP-binding protein